MFGYLTPYKKQLSEEDAQSYQSYYCGLCETLGSHFGSKSELILQYDLVFLAICQLLYSSGAISEVITSVCSIFGLVIMVIALWFQFGKKKDGEGPSGHWPT